MGLDILEITFAYQQNLMVESVRDFLTMHHTENEILENIFENIYLKEALSAILTDLKSLYLHRILNRT